MFQVINFYKGILPADVLESTMVDLEFETGGAAGGGAASAPAAAARNVGDRYIPAKFMPATPLVREAMKHMLPRSERKPLGNFSTSIRDGFPFQKCQAAIVEAYLAQAERQFARKKSAGGAEDESDFGWGPTSNFIDNPESLAVTGQEWRLFLCLVAVMCERQVSRMQEVTLLLKLRLASDAKAVTLESLETVEARLRTRDFNQIPGAHRNTVPKSAATGPGRSGDRAAR